MSDRDEKIDAIAREITNEIDCEARARKRVCYAPHVGDVYLLKTLLDVIDNQNAALVEWQLVANSHADLVKALEKVRSYNVDIAAGRINYRPEDHIQVIDQALAKAGESTRQGNVVRDGAGE